MFDPESIECAGDSLVDRIDFLSARKTLNSPRPLTSSENTLFSNRNMIFRIKDDVSDFNIKDAPLRP